MAHHDAMERLGASYSQSMRIQASSLLEKQCHWPGPRTIHEGLLLSLSSPIPLWQDVCFDFMLREESKDGFRMIYYRD
jgi:hypothetical protein